MSAETAPPRPFRRWTGRFAFLYLLIVVAFVVWFRLAADESWPATLVLFGPRWLAAAPLVLLLPLALLLRSKLGIASCGLAALAIAGPFMGGVLSFSPGMPASPAGLRIATFNADNKAADRGRLKEWLALWNPDVLCLQDAGRITESDLPADYRLTVAANNLRLASRHPATLVGELSNDSLGRARGAARFRVSLPDGAREIVNLHLPTPRPGLEALLARAPDGPGKMDAMIRQRSDASADVKHWLGDAAIVAGDFNLPAESTIWRRDWSAFRDAFADAGLGWGWTYFSNRGAVRIDHILCMEPLRCRAVLVGPDLGSAHRPLLADLGP